MNRDYISSREIESGHQRQLESLEIKYPNFSGDLLRSIYHQERKNIESGRGFREDFSTSVRLKVMERLKKINIEAD